MSKIFQFWHCLFPICTSYLLVRAQDTRPFLNTWVTPGDTPYIAFVQSMSNSKKCTGSILDKNWVLTLASCVPQPINQGNITVSANLNSYDFYDGDEQTRGIAEVIHHPMYKPERLGEADLALLQVDQPFIINTYVRAISLDGGGWPLEEGLPAKQSCTVIGYGDIDHSTRDSRLKFRYVSATHSIDSCSCTRRNQWMNLVCLDVNMEDVGLCPADNGAPLICNEKLVGLTHQLIVRANCSSPDHPEDICGDYAVVSYFMYLCPYLSWIKSVVPAAPTQPNFCNTAPNSQPFSQFILMLLIKIFFV